MASLSLDWENAKPASIESDWDNATPQEATATNRIGNLARGFNKGTIAGLAGLPVDTAENLFNLAKAGVGTAATALGRPDLAPGITTGSFGGSQSIARGLNSIGLGTENANPEDTTSRMLNTAGGLVLPGVGLKSNLAAAAGGALASEVGGKEWTAVGALAPATMAQGAAAIKNSIAAKAAPNVETFKQAGAMPSVGQALGGSFLSGLENLAAKFPGGSGVMKKFIETQQANMGAQARTGVPTEAAGRAIEKGISGEGGFLERTKKTWVMLDDAVAKKIPANSTFQPINTTKALDDLTTPIPGAERSTGSPLDARISTIKNDLVADLTANNGQMSFEALRKIRSRVGAQVDDAMVQGAKSGEMSKLYGALSKDLEVAATQSGAGREFARQNKYYRVRMEKIEGVLERVIGKGKLPEDIFKSFMPTDRDAANKVRAVMRSISPSERQVVSEAVANRLGRAKPGSQDISNELFSSETFLSNWGNLSPGAKMQLFPDAPLRENMGRIAKAASEIRTGKGVYANPSGTAGSFAAYAVYMGPIAAIGGGLGGFPGALATSVTAAGSANIGAKMLTSPTVVNWLAKPVNPSNPKELTAHLVRLGVIYNGTKDDKLKAELGDYMQSISPKEEQ